MSLREHHAQTTTTTTSTSQSHLYLQALQLKLYQAFIFSIPVLFSIILFLLFYLFYLKRRASNLQSSPSILIRRRNLNLANSAPPSNSQYVLSSPCAMDFKGELKEKLHIILFDDELKKKDSQCCVCLGEFETDEELLQVQSCKHVFHVECIHHWLHNNTTCPLCRCSVIPISMSSKIDTSTNPTLATTASTEPPPPPAQQHHHSIVVSHHSPGIVSLHLRRQQQQDNSVSAAPNVTAAAVGELESPSNPPTASVAGSGGSALTESGGCSSNSDRGLGDSCTIHIQDV